MQKASNYVLFKRLVCLLAIGLFSLWSSQTYAQDSTKSILDINNSKLVKKANEFLDSNQKKINNFFNKKINAAKDSLNKKTNSLIEKPGFNEIDKPLPYERLLNKKYTLGRRAYQNTVSQFNYLFHADETLNEMIQKAKAQHEDDFTELLPFYNYDLSNTAKESIDSIIYRCNANIVLHDLRSNYVDDAYLLLAKAYLFHKNFDTAASILQFINYSFYDKEEGADMPIGSNLNKTGRFSIASVEDGRAWENKNVRNESMIWQARNYFEAGELNEGISLLQLLKTDAGFPKRLYPFLYEQLAYGYYQSGNYDSAANYLTKGLDNAQDLLTKARWSYLIAQLYEKEQKIDLAYQWYRKAGAIASDPIIAVYSSIYMTSIEANRGEKSWTSLAATLERMLKKDKYKPFADIIYYEMAQLAVKNNASLKANQWLIKSIQKNVRNNKLKQKALAQLGALNYKEDHFTVAKIAYDQLNNLLKSYPNYDQIMLRKKWMEQIEGYDVVIAKEDSLQLIYALPEKEQIIAALQWQKRSTAIAVLNKDLFADPEKQNIENTPTVAAVNNFSNSNFNNPMPSMGMNNSSTSSDFYFDNPYTVNNGINQFKQKWGDRPNVDNWRRKTNIQLAKNTTIKPSDDKVQNQDSTKLVVKGKNKKQSTVSKDSTEQLSIKLIESAADLKESRETWNKNTLAIAKTFLYELNDFEKALPRYQTLIQKNIDPVTTEDALLDLASHYLHIGQVEKSESIIENIIEKFPNGIYVNKKKAKEKLDRINKNTTEAYKEAYFVAQIGDWDKFNVQKDSLLLQFKGTKWQTPFQFLTIKMYAQLRKDSIALVLLNEVISRNSSEAVKARAKNIITEINNRKTTEAYLVALKIVQPKAVDKIEATNANASTLAKITTPKNEGTQASKIQIDSLKSDPTIANQLVFTSDSLEQHYIALQTTNISPTFVKEIQNAFKDVHAEEFRKLNLSVTNVQFSEQSYIVWIGPFENAATGLQYIQKVKPRLSTEIISFIAKKQYDLILIGKSNIIQINDPAQLEQYKRDKAKYYFKP
jgi:tetratricopeptide (TPR) repeat protein